MDSNIKKNLIGLGLFVLLILFLAGLATPSVGGRQLSQGQLVQALNNERQIHMGVQSLALDQETTHDKKGAWPADSGAKTGREYVKYLIDQGVFKPGDMKIFTTAGFTMNTDVDHLSTNNIAFHFANVSKDDPPNTIFIVSDSYINVPPPKPWWDFFSTTPPMKGGFVVFVKGGDGVFYTKRKPDQKDIIGILPPREPKFLPP